MAPLPSSYFPQTIVTKKTRWVGEEKSPFGDFHHPIYFCHVLFNAECEMQIKYLYRSTGSDKRSCTSFQAQSNLRLCVQHSLAAPLHFAIKNSYADFYLSTGNSQATYRVFMLITHSSHSLWMVVHLIHSQTVASLKEASVWNMFILHHGAVTREASFTEFHFSEFHSSDFNKKVRKERKKKKTAQNSLKHGQEEISRDCYPCKTQAN